MWGWWLPMDVPKTWPLCGSRTKVCSNRLAKNTNPTAYHCTVTITPPCALPSHLKTANHQANVNPSGINVSGVVNFPVIFPGAGNAAQNKALLKVFAWIIRTIQDSSKCPERRTVKIDHELSHYNTDVVGLGETRFAKEKSIEEKNYIFLWKGKEKNPPKQQEANFVIMTIKIIISWNQRTPCHCLVQTSCKKARQLHQLLCPSFTCRNPNRRDLL